MSLFKKKFFYGIIPVFLVAALLSGCPGPLDQTDPPATPAAPTLVAGDGRLTVNWTAVDDATAYEVWHGTSNASASAEKFGEDLTGTSATITGLANGTTYYVWIKAKNDGGASGFSPPASGTPTAATEAPTAPAAPTVVAGNGRLTVSWAAQNDAVTYEVWHGTSNASADAEQFGEELTGTSATITGLNNNTTYYVWIKAKNSAGTSAFSAVVTATPRVALGNLQHDWLNAQYGSLLRIGSETTGYFEEWYYALDSEGNIFPESLEDYTGKSYTGVIVDVTDPSRAEGYIYIQLDYVNSLSPSTVGEYYAIRWENFTGTSISTSGAAKETGGIGSATTLQAAKDEFTKENGYYENYTHFALAAPAAPTGLVAQISGSGVTISWNPVEGATGYRVYSRSSSATPGATQGSNTNNTNTTYTFENGNPTYYFWVRAVNDAGRGPWAGVTVPPPSLGNLQHDWLNAMYGSLLRIGSDTTGYYEDWYYAVGAEGDLFPESYEDITGKSYTGVIVDVTDPSQAEGYIYIMLDYVNDDSPSAVGEYYAIRWENFTGTSISTSGAAKIGGMGSASTLQAAKDEFTKENGYYEYYSDFALAVPAAPTGLVAQVSGSDVTISWNPVEGATGYRVYSRSNSATPTAPGSSPNGAMTHTFADTDSTYYFWVRAVNDAGRGPWAGVTLEGPVE